MTALSAPGASISVPSYQAIQWSGQIDSMSWRFFGSDVREYLYPSFGGIAIQDARTSRPSLLKDAVL